MYFKGVNRGLNFTLLGRYLVVMTLGVGGVAVFTGANGMYLFLGISLGLFTVSGLLSEKNIKYIKFHIGSSSQFFEVGQDGSLSYEIENLSSKMHLYSQHIEVFLEPRPKIFKPKREVIANDFIIQLNPNQKLKRDVLIGNLIRGEYNQLHVEQNTKFPFGIFEKFKIEVVGSKIYVLPPKNIEKIKMWEALVNKLRSKTSGHDAFASHQPYHQSIPIKFVDWKKNAGKSMDQWVYKKFESSVGLDEVVLEVQSQLLDMLDDLQFEAILSNLRTGLEVLHTNGFHTEINLNKCGGAYGFLDCKILLAKANRIGTDAVNVRRSKVQSIVFVNEDRAWISND